jgi:hypothetical protein
MSDGHCSYLTSSSSLLYQPIGSMPMNRNFFFPIWPLSNFLILLFSPFFFVYLCMLVTDGHMCQNWHRWEEWWRPSTVTWERKTIRIQCVRWTCYAIRQTNRVKGTWQIFDLNEKKTKNEHRYWRHHIRLLYITFTWEIQTLYLLN